jgi:hypothetical protein
MGRPTTLTKDVILKAAEYMAEGLVASCVCDLMQIPEGTWMQWQRKGRQENARIEKGSMPRPEMVLYAEFAKVIKESRAKCERYHLNNIYTASSTEWQASAWCLQRMRPDVYHPEFSRQVKELIDRLKTLERSHPGKAK